MADVGMYLLFDDVGTTMHCVMVKNRDRQWWQFWRPKMLPTYWTPCGIVQPDGSTIWPEADHG